MNEGNQMVATVAEVKKALLKQREGKSELGE
jgi:hypothetical protein